MIAPASPFDETSPGEQSSGGELVPLESIVELTQAGLPLSAGLLAYSEEVPSSRMRKSLRRMALALDAGRPLEDVLGDKPGTAPDYLRGLVRAGLATSQLGEVLGEHLYCVRRSRLVRTRLWIGLVYPLLLLAAGLSVGLFMLIWPIPAFREIFSDFGVSLPGITMMVIQASDFIVATAAYWPWILFVLLVLAAAIYSIRYLPGRAERVRLFQYLPLIGSASRYAALSEFCSLLSILVQSRVPLPAALRMTADAVRDPNLAAGSRELAAQVAHGLPAESAARTLSHFPGSIATLFRWQGQPEALARALRSSGELFATQARLQSGVVGLLLQPLLLFFIVSFLGTIVIALFMPLIKLLNALS